MSSRNLILNTCDIPSVPTVAIKILKLLTNPRTTLDDLQKAILADQALASRVLKIANSAFYGVRQDIDTISEAIIIMGFNTIRTLILAVSTREAHKTFGLIERKLWEHSLGVSIAAGIIASEVAHIKKEEAVVAGLLHDIGKAVMNNNSPERFSILTQQVYSKRVTYESIEQDIFGFSHAEAGYLLAEKWGFPPILCNVINNHHRHDLETSPSEDLYERLLCSAVALSDALCVKLGVGYRGPMADLNLGEERLRKILGITEDRYYEIIDIFKASYIEEKMSYEE